MTEKEREVYRGKGFTSDQINEIQEGLDKGLEVDIYAQKDYFAIQMRQIRFGLEEGIAVENYASPEYDWFQMEEIRLGLEAGADISKYADPGIPYDKMRQVREGLLADIDLTGFLQFEAGVLRELRLALQEKLDILPYIEKGYETEQLKQIRISLEKGVDIEPYLAKELRGPSISEICEGLERGLDVTSYARVEFSWQQMREIRLGLESRIDIGKYANSFYNWQQMREIRLGLENGIDTDKYGSLMFTVSEMKKMRYLLEQQNMLSDILVEKPPGTEESGVGGSGLNEKEPFQDYTVKISRDEMEAYLEIHIPGIKFDKEELGQMLKQNGVKSGILEEELEKIASGSYLSRPILIARGAESRDGADGWYEFFFRTREQRKPKLLADGSVDYQNTQWLEMVKEGQKLAYYHEPEAGRGGYTVTGRFLPGRRGKEKAMLYGRGFTLLPDKKTYQATISGKIEMYGDRMDISRLLLLDHVTFASGKIEFDGTVQIRGNVGCGTIIKATEDILVEGYVESAVLESLGNIVLKQGVNASGNGMIRAAKSVQGRFFESARIYAGEDIQANYCLNSELYADGQILIRGRESVLVGGVTSAVKGISVGHAGNKAGLATVLRLGVNESMQRAKRELDDKIREAQKELSILRNAYADFRQKYPPEQRNTMDMFLKIESAIFTKEQQMDELEVARTKLLEGWKKNQNVMAVIRGNLYEGVLVEIDGVRWAAKDLHNITLKRVENRIAVFANR